MSHVMSAAPGKPCLNQMELSSRKRQGGLYAIRYYNFAKWLHRQPMITMISSRVVTHAASQRTPQPPKRNPLQISTHIRGGGVGGDVKVYLEWELYGKGTLLLIIPTPRLQTPQIVRSLYFKPYNPKPRNCNCPSTWYKQAATNSV